MKSPHVIFWIVVITSLFFVVLLACVYFVQGKFLYFPNQPGDSRDPKKASIATQAKFEELWLDVQKGASIHCVWLPYDRANGQSVSPQLNVMLFHGNAGNLNDRVDVALALRDCLSANVVMVSYRGYGLSRGDLPPSQAGIQADSRAAYEWLCKKSPLPIVIYGQSLGGAVSISLVDWALASSVSDESKKYLWDRIGGLIVENSFLSIPKVARHLVPFASPFTFLLTEVWDSETALERIAWTCKKNPKIKVHFPMLFLSGLADNIVPPSHMKSLYSLAKKIGGQARLVTFPNAEHNNTCDKPNYFVEIQKFFS